MRTFLAVAVALLTGPLAAAVIGPEIPLSVPENVAAPFEQIEPDVASDGQNVLAVWLDARRSLPARTRTLSVYATLLDETAQPLAPNGVEVAGGAYAAEVASDGNAFVIVYATQPQGRVYALRTLDGTAPLPPLLIGSGTVVDVASNGTSYCAVLSEVDGSAHRAVILSTDGWAVKTIPLDDRIDSLAAIDGRYVAAGTSQSCSGSTCTRDVTTTVITESGDVTHNVIASRKPYWTRASLAAGDEGGLVAWVGEDDGERLAESVPIDRNARKNVTPVTVYRSESIGAPGSDLAPSVAFDGGRYLVGFPVPSAESVFRSYYMVSRVNAAGEVLDPYAVALSSAMDDGFVAAERGGDMLLVWSENGDLLGRTMRSFASIDEATEADALIARASNVQSDVRVALVGNTAFAAWVEGEGEAVLAATIDVESSTITQMLTISGYGLVTYAAPSVAAARDAFLVVWRESFDDETRVYAQRFAPNGARIDDDPLLLDVTRRPVVEAGAVTDTAVASDGEHFFAVWRHEQELYGAHIGVGGAAEQPFRISRTDPNYHARVAPSVAWTGEMYLVAWQHDPRNPGPSATALQQTSFVQMARITPAGALLDSASSPVVAQIDGGSDSVAVAAGNGRAIMVWPAAGCVRGAMFSADGQRVSSIEPLDCGVPTDVAATSTQDGFVAAWARGDAIAGARISTSGATLERFTLAEATSWSPALAPFRDRTFVAYARTGGAIFGGVGRVFARTLRGGGKQRSVSR